MTNETPHIDPATPLPPAVLSSVADLPAERLMSLDALRGFDMFWIIGADGLVESLHEVNDSGIVGFFANQLSHVEWRGFHFYDMIFPLFVFMAGVAITFSLDKIIEKEGKAAAYKRVFKRFIILYLIGIIYYGGISKGWEGVRYVGVLQRIAFSYFAAAILYMNLRLRGLVIACAAILIGYWAFMSFVPVPADPGLAAVNPAWGQGGVSFEPGNNWANYIDYHFLPGRRWDKQWDPEGLLSSIPAVATALLGVFAGLLIRDKSIANERKVAILMAAGAAGVVVGYLWGLQFPIIKKLWTSSYVLVAGGYSSMLLGLFMYIIDVQGYRRWATPFVWIGSNALAVYLAVHWIDFDRIASTVLGGPVETAAGDYGELLVTLGALTLSVLFCRFLFKRRVFIRL